MNSSYAYANFVVPPKITHDQWRQRKFNKTSRSTQNRQTTKRICLHERRCSEPWLHEVRALVPVDVQVKFISSINRYPARKQTLEFSHLCVIVSPRRTIDSTTIPWAVFTQIYGEVWHSDCTCQTWVQQNARVSVGLWNKSPLSVSKFYPALLLRSSRHFSVIHLRSSWKKCIVVILWPNRNSREMDVWKKRDKSHVYKIEIDSTKRKQLLPYANPNNDDEYLLLPSGYTNSQMRFKIGYNDNVIEESTTISTRKLVFNRLVKTWSTSPSRPSVMC